MWRFFEGMYYKHQKGQDAISFIAGRTHEHAFIQVITNEQSYYFDFPLEKYSKNGDIIRIGDNVFSNEAIKINVGSIVGEIKYGEFAPLKYDIMGPFKYLPLQCKHRVVSLWHRLEGHISADGKFANFTGGIGYIEGDYGSSFPENYMWLQCNDFSVIARDIVPKQSSDFTNVFKASGLLRRMLKHPSRNDKISIMVSVADIPFMGFHFRGCICVVLIGGKGYRFTTYLGARIIECNEKKIVLKQRNLRLEIDIEEGAGHKLLAPNRGEMNREISERIVCRARFKFEKNGALLFEGSSENASFEYSGHL